MSRAVEAANACTKSSLSMLTRSARAAALLRTSPGEPAFRRAVVQARGIDQDWFWRQEQSPFAMRLTM